MQALHDLKDEDLQGLAPEAIAALAQQMLQRLRQQDNEIRFKDAKIEKITFQLARLKAWKFGAKTEAMNAEQRRLFEETLAEDEASLQAQLEQARGERATTNTSHVVDTARSLAPRGAPPRTGEHELPERGARQADDARGRRHQRTPGHRARRVLRAPPHLWQVGLPLLPMLGAGSSSAADHRWRHACCRARSAHVDQSLLGPPALLPARGDQRPLRRTHSALHAGELVRARQRSPHAAV